MLAHISPPRHHTLTPADRRRPFQERLMGFEPTTFCMASRAGGADSPGLCLQIAGFSASSAHKGFPAFTGRSRGFG